jgi:CO/xanthine dehydrogenase Mo-binding subunit
MATRFVGQPVRRNEDETLLRGRGVYFDDVELPGALQVAFLRSPLAHARIVRLDVSGALDLDGVVAVYTHADLGELDRPLPLLFPTPAIVDARTQRPLASDEVAHVGQTIAMVVAVSRYVAEDALELIDIELEALRPTVDLEASALPGAPPAHTGLASNVAATLAQVTGDPDAAFAAAERTFSARLVLDRGAAMPMETRGVAARFDARSGELTVWDTTQAAIPIRGGLVSALGLAEDKVRVIVPETGGGFGVKAFFFCNRSGGL